MRSFLLETDLLEKDLAACYFLYGEETYLAQDFLDELRELLIPPDAPEFNVERFRFEDTSWREVIDLARTAPFLFSSRRIISLEMPAQSRKDKEREGEERGEGEGRRRDSFSESDERLVRDYLAAPAQRTVLVVVVPGKPNRSRRLFKTLASFPPRVVAAKELRPLKEDSLRAWAGRKLKPWKKDIDREALSLLTEFVGIELERLDKELDKLATYAGDRKTIGEDDVRAVSAWTKDLDNWELENALGTRDAGRCLDVLAGLFQGGNPPTLVFSVLAGHFRAILTAQEGLRAGRDRKEIFAETHPQIRESFGRWYYDRLNEFFSTAQGLGRKELDEYLQRLREIDVRLKTSGAAARPAIEAFVTDYCRRRRPDKAIWPARR